MKSVLLRLPDDLYESTKAKAEREHRSMNSQIVHVLERDAADEESS